MKIQEAVCMLFVFALLTPARGFSKTIYTGDLNDKLSQAVCEKGSGEKIAALIGQGANPNAVQAGGGSPLMQASSCGNLEAAKILVKNGADVNQADDGGYNALLYAVRGDSFTINGAPIVVKFLLDHGITINEIVFIRALNRKGWGKATGKDGTSIGYICDAIRKSGRTQDNWWMITLCDAPYPNIYDQSDDKDRKAYKMTRKQQKQYEKALYIAKQLIDDAFPSETPAP